MATSEEEKALAIERSRLELRKITLEIAENEKRANTKWYKTGTFFKIIGAILIGFPIAITYIEILIVPKYENERLKQEMEITQKKKELDEEKYRNTINEYNLKLSELKSMDEIRNLNLTIEKAKQQIAERERELTQRETNYSADKRNLDQKLKIATDWIERDQELVSITKQLDDIMDMVIVVVDINGLTSKDKQIEYYEKAIPYFERFEKESIPKISDKTIRDEFFYFKTAVNNYIISVKAGEQVEIDKKRTYSIFKYIYLNHLVLEYRNRESTATNLTLQSALKRFDK